MDLYLIDIIDHILRKRNNNNKLYFKGLDGGDVIYRYHSSIMKWKRIHLFVMDKPKKINIFKRYYNYIHSDKIFEEDGYHSKRSKKRFGLFMLTSIILICSVLTLIIYLIKYY